MQNGIYICILMAKIGVDGRETLLDNAAWLDGRVTSP